MSSDYQPSRIKPILAAIGKTILSLNVVQCLRWALIIGVWCVLFGLIYVLKVAQDLPSITKLEEPRKGRKVSILDDHGHIVTTYGAIYGYYVPFNEIPKNLVNAVVAIEDRRFFNHFGVDVWGILRAMIANARAGHTVQGGSTLTQQLAKNVFLSSQRTLKRKAQEALLAIELERSYSKEQIMAIYLNRVYLGAGLYGIDAAAKYYFGKNVQDLSLYECAIIAGLPKAPTRYSPISNPEYAGQRAYHVLQAMLEEGYITKAQFDQAADHGVTLNTALLGSKDYGYFTSWVYENIGSYIGNSEDVDLSVKTTLDRRVQKISQDILNGYIDKYGKEKKMSQGAVVVLDRSGKILAMVGGTNFSLSPFNRVAQSLRQAGSAFKVFVYTAAMLSGYTPESRFVDKPIRFGTWAPENFNKNFLGEISLDEAFSKSINTISVQLANRVGIAKVIDVARRLGITAHIQQDLSIALGTPSVSLLELTGAYGILANDGRFMNPYAVETIENSRNGNVLYVRHEPANYQAIDEDIARTMQAMMRNCVVQGSAHAANVPQIAIAGKTGTSQDHRDAWFLSYTDKYIVGVWLGNDDYSPMKRVSGATHPVLIARDILLALK